MGYIGEMSFEPKYRYLIFATDKIDERKDFRGFILDFPDIDGWKMSNIRSDRDMAMLIFSQPSIYNSVPGENKYIGNIYFVCGYKYLIYYVPDKVDEVISLESNSGWHLEKRYANVYGTMLVFRQKE